MAARKWFVIFMSLQIPASIAGLYPYELKLRK